MQFKNKDGSTREYLQIIKSYRQGKRTRQNGRRSDSAESSRNVL